MGTENSITISGFTGSHLCWLGFLGTEAILSQMTRMIFPVRVLLLTIGILVFSLMTIDSLADKGVRSVF